LFDNKTFFLKFFSKVFFSKKKFLKKEFLNYLVLKLIKIKFMGRIYKIKKFKLILLPRIQYAHKLILILKNTFILKWKRRKR